MKIDLKKTHNNPLLEDGQSYLLGYNEAACNNKEIKRL